MNDPTSKSGASTPRLGHVHLHVRSLDRSIDFYQRLFELAVSERIGGSMAFLTSSQQHHTVALQALGEGASPPAPGSVGLYHVAFEVPSAAALDEALGRLDDLGVRWQVVDHGISWAVYFDDPNGNGLEIYVDMRNRPGGRHEWHGTTEALPREHIRRAAARERDNDQHSIEQPAAPAQR